MERASGKTMIRISRHVRKEMMRQYKMVLIVGALAIPSFAISQLNEIFLELWDEKDPARKIALADELLPDARHNEKQCAWLHVFRGQGYKALDRIDEACAAFDRAAKLDGKNAAAHAGSGSCSMKLEEYSRVADAFGVALRIDPSRTDARVSRGLAFIHLSDWRSAQNTFEELKKRDASDARAWESSTQTKVVNSMPGSACSGLKSYRRNSDGHIPSRSLSSVRKLITRPSILLLAH